jgi:hypothetical protein
LLGRRRRAGGRIVLRSLAVIRPEIDANAIKRLVAELKDIDPKLARQLGKDLKSELLPFASAIQREMPSESPLSGMVHNGVKGWSPAVVKVSATPGAGWGRSMARIVIEGKPRPAMIKIAEFAGSSSYTKSTGPGQSLSRNLDRAGFPLVKGRGGRFGFANYYKKQPEMLQIIQKVIDRFVKLTNKRFD